MPYVPLWVKSNFSFLEGASHPQELVDAAHELGCPALALTDRDGVYGMVEAHVRAKELGTRLIVGAEVTLCDEVEGSQSAAATSSPMMHRAGAKKGASRSVSADGPQVALRNRPRIVLLCATRSGYANLCQLLSKGRQRSTKGSSAVTLGELAAANEGLLALCPDAELLDDLKAAFEDRLYALCARHLEERERAAEQKLRARGRALGLATVAAVEVLYHGVSRSALQDVLTAILHGVALSQAGTLLRPNAQHALEPPHAMRQLFADDPAALERTLEVADRARFSLAELRYRYPAERRPDGKSEEDWLRELTLRGAQVRYGATIPDEVMAQLRRELELIHELDYGGYFLTMYEIVERCKSQNILCQGRGSAANSAVCYCLGITAVDPVKLDLLFERFLSRERAEPPDIDLDIEHERREEIIQWVYERYGRRHAAMVANVIRYRTRSAIRDVGKALGLPLTALDRLSKLLGSRFGELGFDVLEHAGLDVSSPVHQHLLKLLEEIQEFPRHLSIHPGGFLLGHEPVDTLVPIEPATMPGRTVIQWDKYAIEDLGLFKVDLLGLGALTQLHACFDLVREHEGIDLDMARVPAGDAKTYAMVSRADTVGVFQIESRAQMSMLPRLQPRSFYDLVIQVAIVRPGPIQGNMVHPYLKRRRGEEEADYPHESLRKVLEKTLGVPIFQEQVMKIAVLVGGYTPGQADQLRRDIAAWKSSGRIERHHDLLVARMIQNGIGEEYAERVFSQIRGFGEYGFPESHAASFALIAYVTAYQRAHHPAAFVCSLLNAQPMGFYSPATIVEDALRHGVEVRPIDVQKSAWPCTLERDAAPDPSRASPLRVRMGLRYVKGLGVRDEEALAGARGPYRDVEDFLRRTRLSAASVERLAEAGAFESLEAGRREALWTVKGLAVEVAEDLPLLARASSIDTPERQRSLFPALTRPEEIAWDYRTSHHSTRGHPMLTIRPELARRRFPTAVELNRLPDGKRTKYVGMTICRQQPGTSTGVTFYTLEDETGFVNLVVWRQVFERYSVVARTALVMGVTGRVQSEEGVVHLIADRLWEPELAFDGSGTSTRSFH